MKTSAPSSQAPSLREQMEWAAHGLQQVAQGQSAREVVAEWPASPIRPGAQALLYTALRHWGQTRALITILASKKPQAPVEALLAIALSLLLEPEGADYAPFTVVNQTVEVLQRSKKWQAQSGFVNACLRRFLREREALMATVARNVAARTNHPQWWVDMLKKDHPSQWEQILVANNARAPLTIRVNTARISRDDYLQQLRSAAYGAEAVLEAGIVLHKAVDVRELPGYDQGWFSVQDAAAQYAAPMLFGDLAPQPGSSAQPLLVLDACAAPGGKTAHLLEWATTHGLQVELLAIDVDAQRAERIADNMQRLGFEGQVRIEVADAGKPQAWSERLLGQRMLDLILLDAPCSASGIVRRHADIRWLRRAEDLDTLVRVQEQILQRLWALLKPGGRLLYCTCSVFHREGRDQMQKFLSAHADAIQIGDCLQLFPAQSQGTDSLAQNHDGFFYGLLQKAL